MVSGQEAQQKPRSMGGGYHIYIYITYLHAYLIVYIYTYIHIYIYTYIHIYIYTYMHSYTYIHIYTYVHIYVYTEIHIHIRIICTSISVCIYIYIYSHIHIYSCIQKYRYIYMVPPPPIDPFFWASTTHSGKILRVQGYIACFSHSRGRAPLNVHAAPNFFDIYGVQFQKFQKLDLKSKIED